MHGELFCGLWLLGAVRVIFAADVINLLGFLFFQGFINVLWVIFLLGIIIMLGVITVLFFYYA